MSGSVDTVLLRTFLEVHKTRHFGRAAEQLYLTQSAVSFRIRQLEELLGVKLFERYRNNIRLTLSGERLLPHAEAMLTTWQRALQEVSQGNSPRQPLAIGASASLWDALLLQPVVDFSTQHDTVALCTETANGTTLIRGLLEHTLDLAVLIDPPKVEELQAHPLGSVELGLVASCPVNSADTLDELDYVLINWGTAFSIQQTRALPRSLTPVLQTSQTRIALEYLLSKPAVAFLPDSVAEPHLQAKTLHPVPEVARIQRALHLVYRKGHQSQGLIEQLGAFLCTALATRDE